ncbi:MAG: enoyl-CoA hydratase/isomerase family protein [Betaproteobacteria bacterium]|nr:enoyl-CoA hydratase/isomerase family protein [Betaproteobacteria bacterium]
MSLVYEKRDHIALVRLNRPEAMNAIDPETREELWRAWADIAADDDVRVAIITGTGEKAFCTGADLKKPFPAPDSFAQQLFTTGKPGLTDGMNMLKPLIGAVNGFAIGGGLEIALACDVRIASETAAFGLSEVRIGSLPGAGGTQRLPRVIPQAVAMKMLLTGDRISAQEAYRIGLISDVVPPDRLMPLAYEIAGRICDNAPLSVRAVKLAANRGLEMSLGDGLYLEGALFGILRDTEDRAEGRQAFAEKRRPHYKGR